MFRDAVVRRFEGQAGRPHLRKLHYLCVTAPPDNPVRWPDGRAYENTLDDWLDLLKYSRKARWLGYVGIEDFDDQRNAWPDWELPEIDADIHVEKWKPVVIFGGGPAGRWVGDVVHSEMPDKSLHEYQQSVPGFMRLVERLSVPHALVCDPFTGTGTTAVACVRLHRRFVGCDTDKEMVEKARAQAALAASAS
jgi:hypothetical protein